MKPHFPPSESVPIEFCDSEITEFSLFPTYLKALKLANFDLFAEASNSELRL